MCERRSMPRSTANIVFKPTQFSGLKGVRAAKKAKDDGDGGEAPDRISERLRKEGFTREGRGKLKALSVVPTWACDGTVTGGGLEDGAEGALGDALAQENATLHAMSMRVGAAAPCVAQATAVGAARHAHAAVQAARDAEQEWTCPILLSASQARNHPRWLDLKAAAQAELDTCIEQFGALQKIRGDHLPDNPRLCNLIMNYSLKDANSVMDARAKARLCFDGSTEKEGVDYDPIQCGAATLRVTGFRMLCAFAVHNRCALRCSDQKGAFLNAAVRDGPRLFGRMPKELREYEIVDGKEVEILYEIVGALYGEKQSMNQFVRLHVDWFARERKWEQSYAEPGLFVKRDESGAVVAAACAFVDDVAWAFVDEATQRSEEKAYCDKFQAKFADCTSFIGIDVAYDRDAGKLKLTQASYIKRAVEELLTPEEIAGKAPTSPASRDLDKMTGAAELGRLPKCDEKTLRDYRVRVGTLLYIAITSQPGLAHPSGKLGRGNHNPCKQLLKECVQPLLWAYHHREEGVEFSRDMPAVLVGHSDSDWDTKNATAAWVIGCCGGCVSWASKKERCVTLSSTEAELVAASMAACEMLYLRFIAEDLGLRQEKASCLYVDNQGAVEIAKNPVSSTALKHVLRRHFFVREAEADGIVSVCPIDTADNLADALTKTVEWSKLSVMLSKIKKCLV